MCNYDSADPDPNEVESGSRVVMILVCVYFGSRLLELGVGRNLSARHVSLVRGMCEPKHKHPCRSKRGRV
jgi:hypothetical protein